MDIEALNLRNISAKYVNCLRGGKRFLIVMRVKKLTTRPCLTSIEVG